MSSYIIAGSADSIETAYCQQIARRIRAKYKNIDFRVVIKHPSQWQQYLQQICRIYGFLKKSNPIIYTFDGKIIGNKQAFMSTTAKYFGLDQELLNVQNLTNEVNMKIATQQINRKHLAKNNIKTMTQKIQSHYLKLLKQNILKQQLKQKQQYLTNGISYIHRGIKGITSAISFIKNKQIKVQIQQIVCSDIDLLAVSLNDQIKVEQVVGVPSHLIGGKQAFVTTNNQKVNSQHDKMSQASKTNKMHQSIISYDKDSKQMKQSSKSKLRIDQQNDDCPDYVDYPVNQTIITQLADQFYVAFNKSTNTYIRGQMIFYHNQDQNGNSIRVYNDNRPVNGHRVQIKQVYYDGVNAILTQDTPQQIQQNRDNLNYTQLQNKKGQLRQGKTQNNIQLTPLHSQQEQKKITNQQQNKIESNINEQKHSQQSSHVQKHKLQPQKYKTQPNIPQNSQLKSSLLHDDDDISQVDSDLNLVSNLNYHTLFVKKPLSIIQLKNILYFIQETDCIGCLQFLPQNPNPKLNFYYRKLLLNDSNQQQNDNNIRILLPVQQFIQKQIQDEQFNKLQVPNQKCYDLQSLQKQSKYQILQINDIGFEHYIYQFDNQSINQQTISKVIKYSIDALFSLQEQLKKDIGYNLVFTKKFLMIVPLAEPYQIYNQTKIYLDGLAYLGFVHLAQLIKPYQLKNNKINNMGQHIRELLSKCADGKPYRE